jgi:pimeloyl-ACP methyl ester carboxylesterase
MPKLRVNQIAIEYDCFGSEDAEPILLIAGLGTQMISWSVPFCGALASHGYRVIRFDNRDAGLSTHLDEAPIPDMASVAAALRRGDAPDVPYTLFDMAGDTIGVLDELSIERAHIVGRSMGGMIAQLVASGHPHRTLSLTSIMSSSGNPENPPAAPEIMALLTRRAPDPSEDEIGFLAHRMAFSRSISGRGHPFDEASQRVQALAESRRAYNPSGFGRQIAAIAATGDCRAFLPGITAPTLVVHGSDDPLIPVEAAKDISRIIRGAELLIIQGMGHGIPPPLYETIAAAIATNARRASPTASFAPNDVTPVDHADASR